jgi:chemotaxis signal transduction protein
VSPVRKPATKRRGEPMILFAVGPYTFAIAAVEVDEIREMHDLHPLPHAPGFSRIQNTIHRGKRDYYVVDAATHFQMVPSKPGRLLVLRNHPVAVTADSIDKMTEVESVHSLPKPFRGLERSWYTGLAILDGNVIPVVNPASFLSVGDVLELKKKGAAS